ncbi:MAG: MATE family efflux transporter [Clostridia bacterium]|nr:MATE family efflux transporter [Clostridia bacterium]
MGRKTYEIDMVNGSVFKSVVAFVVPLILGNVLQLLYNAADIIVVSRFAGSDAMASVGATGSLSALIVSLFIGLTAGAGVVVSRYHGARDGMGVHKAVHTSISIGIVAGLVASAVGIIFSSYLLKLMGTPEGKVLNGAVLYMKIYFMGVPASLVYNFGASILRAIGDTRRPLYILAFSGMVNVILNLVFVIGFNMSVEGVAIATAVSNYISAISVIFILVRAEGAHHLNFKELRFHKKELADIVKIGLPAGIQSSLFSVANTIIQSSVNSFGTASIAGSAAAGNIEGFVYTAMNAFYQAAITGVSQNYGAKNKDGVRKTVRVCSASVAAVGFVLGLVTTIFARPLLSIYITDSKEAIDYGVIRMVVSGLPYFLCGIMEVQAGLLRGLGYSTTAMVNSLIGACGFRIFWIIFILPIWHTTFVLFLCWPISWILVIVMHFVCYKAVKNKAYLRMNEQ